MNRQIQKIQKIVNRDQLELSETYKVIEKRKKRDKMNGWLQSWGAYKVPGAALVCSLSTIVDCKGEVMGGTGHDHALITDFQSDMIRLDMLIDELNPVDHDLISYHYRHEYKKPEKAWCAKYAREPKTYKNKRSQILLKIFDRFNPN